MKTSSLLTLLSLFNSKSQALNVISPFYPTRIIEPQIINCNTAFIYAETSELLAPSDESKLLFQEQTKYLNKLFNSPSFQINLERHKGIIGFKGQNQFLADLELPPSIFMGQNERLIRQLITEQILNIPTFDLDFLAMETMLNSLAIVMVFDISHVPSQSNVFFRQGYPLEFINYNSKRYSLKNLPIISIEDKMIGSPFLPEHSLPISNNTTKVLISIFQLGKNTFFDQKDFNIVTNQFINQAQTRCQLKISKVTFFKGMPFIHSFDSRLDGIKIFVDGNSPNYQHSK